METREKRASSGPKSLQGKVKYVNGKKVKQIMRENRFKFVGGIKTKVNVPGKRSSVIIMLGNSPTILSAKNSCPE